MSNNMSPTHQSFLRMFCFLSFLFDFGGTYLLLILGLLLSAFGHSPEQRRLKPLHPQDVFDLGNQYLNFCVRTRSSVSATSSKEPSTSSPSGLSTVTLVAHSLVTQNVFTDNKQKVGS